MSFCVRISFVFVLLAAVFNRVMQFFALLQTRESFDTTRESAVRLMSKMLDTGCSVG